MEYYTQCSGEHWATILTALINGSDDDDDKH